MVIRLAFVHLLPKSTRLGLLRHYHSYVDDEYIQGMRAAYRSVFGEALRLILGR
jgi:hypothetical protein